MAPLNSRFWRLVIWGGGFLVGGLVVTYGIVNYIVSAPRYQGPPTDHFDGKKFYNEERPSHGGLVRFLRWRLSRDMGAWAAWTEEEPGPGPPKRVDGGGLHVTFINHATVLIQMDGVNLLTDPIWSERASPFAWIGPKRHRAPGLRFEDLPPIDAILISHNHYDHLDIPSLARLIAAHRPRILLGLGNEALLEKKKIGHATALDWWRSVDLSPSLRVTSVPAKHFSGRSFFDRDATLWCGYVIEGPSGTIYFAGDTGYGSHFKRIAERFGPIRLALLPIGAYLPRWFMSPVHISPEEAVRAHQDLGALTSVAIHFGTFALGDDGADQPIVDLRGALEKTKPVRPFWVPRFGEGIDIPPVEQTR